MQALIKPLLRETRLKLIKTMHCYIHLLIKSSNCFSISNGITSLAFVCNVVDANKIVIVSSVKLPLYEYAQVTTGLVDLPIQWYHLKPNPNAVD